MRNLWLIWFFSLVFKIHDSNKSCHFFLNNIFFLNLPVIGYCKLFNGSMILFRPSNSFIIFFLDFIDDPSQ